MHMEKQKAGKVNAPQILKTAEIDKSYAQGFFDGACQGYQGICGVGGFLFLKDNHSFSFKAALGIGTNNWAEMYALWLLMRLASEKGINQLQVLGDSNLILDWKN